MGKFIYFAYGSNMRTARLVERCPGAKPLGWALASGYRLAFLKKSKIDGSGKGTLISSANDKCYGVLFEIPLGQRGLLDSFEGRGYERNDAFSVVNSENQRIPTTTYFSKEKIEGLLPYHWYKAHIVDGAEEHNLPGDYVAWLRSLESQRDPDAERTKKEQRYSRAEAISEGKG